MVDWRRLAGLPPAELMNALDSELDGMMRGLSAQEEDERLAGLPGPFRVLWLLEWLDFEVTQGSLLAYFFNSHGRHAELAAEALRDIGAIRMADTVTRAAQLVTAAADEWADRRLELARGGSGQVIVAPYAGMPDADALSELTDEYWAAAEDEDWGDKLESFLAVAVRAAVKSDGIKP